MNEDIIQVFVNPLLWLDATYPFEAEETPTAESVLDYLSRSARGGLKIEDIKKNYSQIVRTAQKLSIVPAEARLLMKIVFPLKNAIGCYMLGNYVESIGISGMVSEMATIFAFEISNINKDGKPIAKEERVKALREIDWLPQSQRTDKLFKYGLITDDTKIRLDCVSNHEISIFIDYLQAIKT